MVAFRDHPVLPGLELKTHPKDKQTKEEKLAALRPKATRLSRREQLKKFLHEIGPDVYKQIVVDGISAAFRWTVVTIAAGAIWVYASDPFGWRSHEWKTEIITIQPK